MSQQHLNERLRALTANGREETLELLDLRCFLGHPDRVGSPSAGGSRPLDLSRVWDRTVFIEATKEKFDHLVNEFGFLKKPELLEHYKACLELLLQDL